MLFMFCFVCVIGLIYREIKSDNIGILDENRNIFLCYRNLENTNRIQSHLLVMYMLVGNGRIKE